MELEIRDERFTRLIDADVEIEHVVSGYQFLEGPVWHPKEKHLVFSDIVGNTMYRWSAVDGLSVFRKPSNMANGNTYDRQGQLLTCEHATSSVTLCGPNSNTEIMASHYQGKELNSPNDIVVKRDGGVYFTDPNSGRGPYYGVPREQELPFQGVYRLDPEDKTLTLLVDDFSKPNGLCFSLEESRLFVNDTDRNHIRVFDVQPDGGLTNGRVWAETIGEGVGVPDGMKIDQDENLYCCGPGGIHVFDKQADCLGVIRMPEQTANFAWGDDDLCSLYIMASSTVYRLRANIPGLELF
ncbi:MAG: SMP-30/gluconolactonase/LRE family protein [Anaerolineales bacterium]